MCVTQFVAGFGAFVFPGAAQATRAALVPRHALIGSLVPTVLAGVTIQLGILEYLTFQGLAKTGSKLDDEQYTLHFVAALCLIVSVITFALLWNLPLTPPATTNEPHAREDDPLLSSHT